MESCNYDRARTHEASSKREEAVGDVRGKDVAPYTEMLVPKEKVENWKIWTSMNKLRRGAGEGAEGSGGKNWRSTWFSHSGS